MLSIGEFSNICHVSTKTLRYYAEIGLILPDEINPENGYRYYSVKQLKRMLYINRLKSYNFSLEEIRSILDAKKPQDEKLYVELVRKKKELQKMIQELNDTLDRLNKDILTLEQGRSIMSYMDHIDVSMTEVPTMYLLSIRKNVRESEFEEEYPYCFGRLYEKARDLGLTIAAPPIALFHSAEFCPAGLDIEFAIPVKEYAAGAREFCPGLCLKTTLYGSYSELSSVYTRQRDWAEKEGYVSSNTVFEVYVTNPSSQAQGDSLITEIYYPVSKRLTIKDSRLR
ncbi:MerR family transcriptional regulator [Clostridium sp. SL.3.18]|nr:MerR family transcriptional regulator [Clostridium sp. SL.3.18]